MLIAALENAASHLILHSCFLDAKAVEGLLPEFERAARRRVRVDLIWGLSFDPESTKAANVVAEVQKVLGTLSADARKLVQLSPISSGSHAKQILHDTADGAWVTYTGSCNYLSSWFTAIDITVRSRSQRFAAIILGKLLAAQLPASGNWSPLARRLSRIWNSVRSANSEHSEIGTHKISALVDGDHYALVRLARDLAKKRIAIGCDLYGLAAETSVMTPLQRAAELGRQVRVIYQRTSKGFKQAGRTPDSAAALAVEPQQVVPGQTESADGCFSTDAGERPVPIVAVQPIRQLLGSLP
jgi:hypothetical protein